MKLFQFNVQRLATDAQESCLQRSPAKSGVLVSVSAHGVEEMRAVDETIEIGTRY